MRYAMILLSGLLIFGADTPPQDTDSEKLQAGPTEFREVKTVEEAKALIEDSSEPVFIFKHSTECPISAGAAYRVNEYVKAHKGEDQPKFVWLKVIESRPASNFVAEELGVKHESPQIILVKDGKAVWNTSHEKITAENVEKARKEIAPEEAEG